VTVSHRDSRQHAVVSVTVSHRDWRDGLSQRLTTTRSG